MFNYVFKTPFSHSNFEILFDTSIILKGENSCLFWNDRCVVVFFQMQNQNIIFHDYFPKHFEFL